MPWLANTWLSYLTFWPDLGRVRRSRARASAAPAPPRAAAGRARRRSCGAAACRRPRPAHRRATGRRCRRGIGSSESVSVSSATSGAASSRAQPGVERLERDQRLVVRDDRLRRHAVGHVDRRTAGGAPRADRAGAPRRWPSRAPSLIEAEAVAVVEGQQRRHVDRRRSARPSNSGQPEDVPGEVAVGRHRHQAAALRQPVERLAQVVADHALDRRRRGDHALERCRARRSTSPPSSARPCRRPGTLSTVSPISAR